jgi:uncharacterized protein (DUF1330 family)
MQAQAEQSPGVYTISKIEVSDPAKYAQTVAPGGQDAIRKLGGTILAVGGAAATDKARRAEALYGPAGLVTEKTRIVINHFPTWEAAKAWADGGKERRAQAEASGVATFHGIAVDGVAPSSGTY